MRRSSLTLILFILGLIAGCVSAPVTGPTPTPERTSTATGIPVSPTPAWSISGPDLELQAIDEGLLLTGTFENTTVSSIAQIELDAQLVDEQGEIVVQASLQPVPSALAAGETAGFAIVFPAPGRPVLPVVRVQAYEQVPANKTRVSVEIMDVRPGNDGQTYVVGEIFNHSFNYARVDDLLLLAAGAATSPGAAFLIPGNQGLPPRSSVFFLASVVGMAPVASWRTFVDVSTSGTPDTPKLVLTEPITLHFTDQGRPFHILQIQNQGSLPRWLGGQLALFTEGTLLSLSDISSPYPLQPGEIRVISIKTYPGLPSDPASTLVSMETWQPELRLDALRSRPALEPVLSLKVEVAQFETIGGLIFIRGNLTNEHPAAVVDPSVQVVSRDQSGRVLDSAWVKPAKDLATGDTVSFELTLMLPAGTTAEMSEYDIQGQGITRSGE